jgi:hypothetical protein
MIDHTNCDHPRTSGARAKCRRAAAGGDAPKTKVMGKKTRDPKDDDNYGQVPRDRHLECDNCGVERIAYRGTDPLTGILRFVGNRCLYTIARSDDLIPLD